VPESASQEEIRNAFRTLAFRYHPDKNPGDEKAAEARFKEINEAFGVLGDEAKRLQYDSARKGGFAGAAYNAGRGGFAYSQQDIFRGIFNDPAMAAELNRVFAGSGLRFDPEFLNRVFFSGQGFTYHVYTSPGAAGRRMYHGQPGGTGTPAPVYKPGWVERLLLRTGRFMMRRVLGVKLPEDNRRLDRFQKILLSAATAARGGERQVTCRQAGRRKKLVVTIPAGVRTGTRIRLKGMGELKDGNYGDLYLEIRVPKGDLARPDVGSLGHDDNSRV
jgi:curved DNA-binding protein CbpA